MFKEKSEFEKCEAEERKRSSSIRPEESSVKRGSLWFKQCLRALARRVANSRAVIIDSLTLHFESDSNSHNELSDFK